MRKTSFFFPATRLISRLESMGYRVEGPNNASNKTTQHIYIYNEDRRQVARGARYGTFGELSILCLEYDHRQFMKQAAKGLAKVY